MSDLNMGLAALGASQRIAGLEKVARKQLEEATKATQYAKLTATAAEAAAKAEQERLALERQRFESEQQDRFQRQEVQQRQKLAREILSDAIVEFSHVPPPSGARPDGSVDLDFSRRVAGVQAKLEVLESIKEVFSELSDMTELRKLKAQVGKSIQTHAADGTCFANPLKDAAVEIEELHGFIARANLLHQTSCGFGVVLLGKKPTPITYDVWSVYWHELHELRRLLPSRFAELRAADRPCLWTDAGMPADELLNLIATKGLLFGHEAAAAETRSIDWCAWHAFALEAGPFYAELTDHLDQVHSRLVSLHDRYQSDQVRWEQARTCAEQANHLVAERILAEGSNDVIDDNYRRCVEAIEPWKDSLERYKQASLVASLEKTALQKLTFVPFALPREMNSRRALLKAARDWVRTQGKEVESYEGTDFGNSLKIVLIEHSNKIDAADKQLEAEGTKRYFQAVAAAMALLIIAAGCFLIGRDGPARLSSKMGASNQSPDAVSSQLLPMTQAEPSKAPDLESSDPRRLDTASGNSAALAAADTPALGDHSAPPPAAPDYGAVSRELLGSLAEQGDKAAQKLFATRLLAEGKVDAIKKAANAGDASATTALGCLYHLGIGVPQDDGLAILEFKKGAASGDSLSIVGAAVLYATGGTNLTMNLPEALAWAEKLQATGDPQAAALVAAIRRGLDAQQAYLARAAEAQRQADDQARRSEWARLARESAVQSPTPTEQPTRDGAVGRTTPPAQRYHVLYSKQSISLRLKNGAITLRKGAEFETLDTLEALGEGDGVTQVIPIWVDRNRTDWNRSYPRTYVNEKYNPAIRGEIPEGVQLPMMYFSQDEIFRAK